MSETLNSERISHDEVMPFSVGSEFINDNDRVAVASKKLEEFEEDFKFFSGRALPAIKLHLFNFFLDNPNPPDQDISRELEKMKILAQKENDAKKMSAILPTVGIELEVPDGCAPGNLRDLCNEIKLNAGRDLGELYEFRPNFSYSAVVQARILHDLEKLIILPEIQRPDEYAPLHVNLGVEVELMDDEEGLERESKCLSSLIALTFVSPERIGGGKWLPAHRFEDLEKGEKHKHAGLRLEIRTPSFERKSDYRMLFEVQALASAMFSFLRDNLGIKRGGKQMLLSTLWSEFKEEFEEFSEKHKFPKDVIKFSEMKKDKPEIEKEAREIFDRYAREAIQIINLK